jgi:hypothetical protein
MILETAQMLSTAYQKHCGEDTNLYKPAYPKHPMTIWVGESVENFNYAHLLGKELGTQYFTRPPLCMPDEYKCDDYIQSYRNYYIGDKKRFARYTSVDTPDFMC